MNQCLSCPTREKHAFCNLGEEAREFLLANSVSVEHPRGTVMFREGDAVEAVYVLCSGRIKVSVTSHEGRTMILRVASAGSVLGLSAAISDVLHETTVEALEPCRVRVIGKRTLHMLLQNFPVTALGAARTIANEYRAAFEEARRIALPENPAGRIACLLLDWMQNSERKNSALVLPLTHEELASMTATTRETVTRTLSRFKKEKLILTKGATLTILQPEALRGLAAC